MNSVIFKAQLIPECSADGDLSCGGGSDGVFRMGWFSVSGKEAVSGQIAPLATDYQYIRNRLGHILCLPNSQDFDVCYRGSDGRRVVIDQDEELRRAVSKLDDGLCKVYVCLKGPNMACG